MAGLRICLFGSLCVTLPDSTDADLRSAKASALLAYLAVESDQAHRREKLTGFLWPDYPESAARASLRRALTDLRQAIGDHEASPPYLRFTRETIQFNTASSAWVDVTTFTTLLGTPAPSSPPGHSPSHATVERLAEAVKLVRAPFLEAFSIPDSPPFEEWALLTRERLDRLAMQAMHHLTEVYQEQGDVARALQLAWRQVEMDRWQESAQRQVIQLLALDGQRGAALAQYELCRQLLAAELGTEPSEQTQELIQRVRTGEWPPKAPATVLGADQARTVVGACPYRGLAAFRVQDAAFFCGRADFTARLAAAVQQGPAVTVIVGSSGSGKSSVVFAGLLPCLRPAGKWLTISLRPGPRPFQSLAGSLIPWLEPNLGEINQLLATQDLARALRGQVLSLADVTARVLTKHSPAGRLLVVVDQFEELYALCPEPTVRQQFLDLLLNAVAPGSGAAPGPRLLLTLRADFMGQALAYRPLADALQAGSILLGPMTRAEMHEAIVRPAEQQGATFEAGLVERILDDVGDEPGNLPLLEFALTLLWEKQAAGRLTHTAYEEIGQATGALARCAEEVFNKLDVADQERAQQVFVQLVLPGEGTDDTRRVATRDEIGEANWPLTRHLADRRLVVTGREADTGQETAEVAHEALIQRWARLRSWLETDRAFRTWQEGLRVALRQWETAARDPDVLLRGAALAQAADWLAAREPALGQAERDFIQAGVQQREQEEVERTAQRARERAAERRARRLLGTLAAVLGAAAVFALLLTAFSFQQRRQAQEAYSLSLAANARRALDDRDTTAGLTLAMAATQIDNPPSEAKRVLIEAAYAPGARWRAEVESLFPGTSGPVTALDISPGGQTALAGLADGSVILWDIDAKSEILRLQGHTARVNDITFSPDGLTALSGSDDRQAIVWDLVTGEAVQRFAGHTGAVRAVDISSNGRTAATGGFAGDAMLDPGELILWDLTRGNEIRRLVGHVAGIVAVAFTPDGSGLLASSGDAAIFADTLPLGTEENQAPGRVTFDMLLWDVARGEVRQHFDTLTDDAFRLAMGPDGTTAMAGSYYSNSAVLWNLKSGQRITTMTGHSEGVNALALSPDGSRALSGSYDDSLILWYLPGGHPVARLNGHDSDVLDLAISPDGSFALSSEQNGRLIRWDLVDAVEVQRLAGHGDMVWDVAFAPDGQTALSSSGAAAPSVPVQDASIRVWDLATGGQIHAFALPVDVIFQVAISPDGRTALVATNEPFVRVWDLPSWQEIGRLEGHAGPVTGVEFAPDGQRALSSSADGTLILWDVPGRQVIHRLSGHGKGLWSLAISPDGRLALSDSGDSSMVLWDLETGDEIRSFQRVDPLPEAGSSGMGFLPDGRSAISCEHDGTLIQWDIESGREVRRLGQHASLRTRIVVSPDGHLAVTSGMDGSLMVWDLERGELIRRSSGHGAMFDLALSPDGQTVLAGSGDRTILAWRLSNPSLEELHAWVKENRIVR